MGHEIVYCVQCATRIPGVEFERGNAFRVRGKIVCAACVPTLSSQEQQEVSLSSTKMKAIKAAPTHGTSVKLSVTRVEPEPDNSNKTVLVACSIGALLVLAGVLVVAFKRPPAPVETPTPPQVLRLDVPPPVDKPEDPQLSQARAAIELARAKARSSPDDLDAQIAVWEEAARKTALTPFFKEASTTLQDLKDRRTALKAPPPRDLEAPAILKKPVDPPPKQPPAELKAYVARWEAAMAKASAREFDAAIAELGQAANALGDEDLKKEARADAEDLQRARAMLAEAQGALATLSKGQSIAIAYRSETGERKQAEGSVVRAVAARIELRKEETTLFVEAEDVAIGTLARLLGGRSEVDRRSLALLCLLEGDRESADRLAGAGAFAPRCWDYAAAATAKAPKPTPRDLESRNRFYAAEREFQKMDTMAAAVLKYKSLLEDYADTRVVKSELARIQKRTEACRDFLFLPIALKGTGTFAIAPAPPRTEIAWASKADVEGNAMLENFVEAEFAPLPDTTYRCWALVGGCCAENFTFYLQTTEGTELHPKTRQKTSIDPGATLAALVKASISGLKKTHEEHKIKGSKTHPKTASRWEWIPIPLPKYAAPGAKKIRLLSEHQGFAVGAIVVSSTRSAPVPEAEMKEEAARVRTASAAAQEGLLGWWRLDETAGVAAQDAVEAGHPGTLKGNPKWTAGKVGGALKFDSGDEVRIEGSYALQTITVSVWVKHDGFSNGVQRYLTLGNEAAVLRCQGDRGAHFYIRTGGELRQLLVANALEAGKWMHLVGTWDGLTMRLYRDGAMIGNLVPGGKLNGDAAGLSIGSLGESMKGLIDEVRVYNRALSDAEIQKQFTEGSQGSIPEMGTAPATPQGKPWRPLFDGSTLSCLRGNSTGWKVEGGALAYIPGTNDAAQTRDDFGDGELRIRFEVKDADRLWFLFRQGASGGYSVSFDNVIKTLEGKQHELIFTAKGEQVTATLDGKPTPVAFQGAASSGCLQFNAAGKMARILSLDVR